MNNLSETLQHPRKLWRLLQFSLRGLLVLIALCSVLLGIAFHRAREQARAVAAVELAGGQSYYDYQWKELYELDESAGSKIPAWLLHGLGIDFFHNVTSVRLDSGEITDRHLAALAGLSELRVLFVDGPVTNYGLSHLKRFKNLQVLVVYSGAINDAGIAELRSLKKLTDLRIFGPIELHNGHVRPRAYRTKSFAGVNITARGLEALKSLPALRVLRLDNTQVTRDGARALSRSLPDCVISVNQALKVVFYVEPHAPPPDW